ncbi:MAG: MmcQ/YjbR family DNA-binding protein [Bacteroidales bacterium]
MNVEELREYCLSFPMSSESFPFDEVTLVIKVAGKMFILFDIEEKPLCANLKCDPDLAQELRERYSFVIPGWHMNKRLWNTVEIDSSEATPEMIKDMITHSYNEVVKGLSKKLQAEIKTLLEEH